MANKRFARMRDLTDHLKQGRLSVSDLGVYLIIHWQTDFKTGVWWGSAPAVHAVAPRGCSLRDVQRSIERLRGIGFLCYTRKHGQRGNYRVLIDKYEVLSGALKGRRLNAIESMHCGELKYDTCAETDALPDAVPDAEAAPIHRVLSSTQDAVKTKHRAAKPAAPADPRFQPFIAQAHESYTAKHGAKPLWQGKDYKALQTLLRNHSPESLPRKRLRALWEHFAASTEPFTAKQGDSLAYFCTNLDKFVAGPILAGKESTNGKGNSTSITEQNMRNLGFAGTKVASDPR